MAHSILSRSPLSLAKSTFAARSERAAPKWIAANKAKTIAMGRKILFITQLSFG
jgi:hypothetical protein